MASFEHLVETKQWPGVNQKAFWSLCERVDDLFILESHTETTAEYVFQSDIDGKLLKAPFDGLYNLYIDSWKDANLESAVLYFNSKAIEKQDGPEINFETFDEQTPLPIGLFRSSDELRLVVTFASPSFTPKALGSARVMRFSWKTTTEPFVITTSCFSALMYDGHQIRAVSHLDEQDSSESLLSLVSTDQPIEKRVLDALLHG